MLPEFASIFDANAQSSGLQPEAFEDLAALAQRHYEELRTLDPPADLEDFHRRQLATTQERAEELAAAGDLTSLLSEAIATGDQQRVFSLFGEMRNLVSSLRTSGAPEELPAILYLRRRSSDELAGYLVKAYEIDQAGNPSDETCFSFEDLPLPGAVGPSEEEFNKQLIECLEPVLPEVEKYEDRWKALVPPREALEYHGESVAIAGAARAQIEALLAALRSDSPFPEESNSDLRAEWLRLQIEWNSLAITALSR